MRVLVACEFSGIVRDAFAALGHDAWSCDLLPTERQGNHIQGDVLPHMNDGWDLMIAHPPCTHIAVSGAAHFAAKRSDGRQQTAVEFFMACINAPISKIAVENPVCIMSRLYRKPDQIIQPYQFGHAESKKTCLWLKGLPKLVPTKIMEPVYYQTAGMPLYGIPPEDYRDSRGKRYSPTRYLTGRMQKARWLQPDTKRAESARTVAREREREKPNVPRNCRRHGAAVGPGMSGEGEICQGRLQNDESTLW